MSDCSETFYSAITLIDAAIADESRSERAGGKCWPIAFLYAHRMSEMLDQYAPEADMVQRLAIRSRYIRRWHVPRDSYFMNRQGYLQWRNRLSGFHAVNAVELLPEAGCTRETIERVRQAVGKRAHKQNPDTQLLEDVAVLVFVEYYMLCLADRHREYTEAKWIGNIHKTWLKLSGRARRFLLGGGIRIPAPLLPLIEKVVVQAERGASP